MRKILKQNFLGLILILIYLVQVKKAESVSNKVIKLTDFIKRTTTPTTLEPIREIIVDGNRLFDFQVDSSFDLICESFKNLVNDAELKTVWTRKTKPDFPSNFQIENDVLHVRNLKESDAGTYECILTYSKKISITIDVTRKPEPATAKIEKRIIRIAEKEKTQVKCYTTGHPKPKVEWLVNGTVVNKLKHFYALDNFLFITGQWSGYLTCRANNSNVTEFAAESNALLVVTPAGKVILAEISPRFVELDAHESVKLKCALLGSYDLINSKIEWFGPDGELIKDSETRDEFELEASKVPAKGGEYACQATDSVWNVKSNVAKTIVKLKPVVKRPKVVIEANVLIESHTVRLNKTNYLAFNCSAMNLNESKSITVQWKKQNGDDEPVLLSTTDNLLEFKNLETSDSGKYACVANKTYLSEWVEVRVDEYEPISLEIHVKEEEEASESSDIVLMCLNLRGKPKPAIKWSRSDNSDIEEDEATIIENEFGAELRLKSSHTRGIFKCLAKNSVEKKIVFINTKTFVSAIPETTAEIETTEVITEPETTTTTTQEETTTTESTTTTTTVPTTTVKTRRSRFTTISQQTRISRRPKKVVRANSTQTIELNVGDNLDIYCSITEESPQNKLYLWNRIDGRKMDRNMFTNRDILKIWNFEQSNAGTYECTESSRDGEQAIRITLRAKQPKLEAKLRTLKWKIDKGKSDYIKCEIINPSVSDPINSVKEIVWTLNGRDIRDFRNLRQIKNELVVERATADLNNGLLKCLIVDFNNVTAEAMTTIEISNIPESLTIEDKSQLRITATNRRINPVSNSVLVKQNENLELKCTITSTEPVMLINWNKQNDQLDPEHHKISEDQSQLTILNIQPRHAGKYMCRAQPIAADPNQIDQVQIVTVVVEPEAKATTRRPVKLSLTRNNIEPELISVDCSVVSGQEDIASIDLKRLTSNGLENIDNYKNFDIDIDNIHLFADLENIPENYGTYICMVRDKQNSLYEKSIQILNPKFAISDNNRIEIDMKYKIERESETFEINCTVNKGQPIRELKISRGFEKNDTIEFIILDQNEENTRISAVISLTDKNVGTYFCQAVNEYEASSTLLNVNYTEDGLLSLNAGITRRQELLTKTQIEVNPKQSRRYIGESLTIGCALVGDEQVIKVDQKNLKFIWSRLDGQLSQSPLNFDPFTGRLVFSSLQLGDSGSYSCQVFSDAHPKVALATVHTEIMVEKRPDSVEPQVRIALTLNSPDGRNPSVKCEVMRGSPYPQLEWRRKDGMPLSLRAIVNGGLLHIQDAGVDDFGVYECVGRNEAGEHVVEFDFEPRV